MKRLNGMDAMLLYSETPNLHTHTLKVAVVDTTDFAGKFDFELFKEVIGRRLHLLEPMRYRLIDIPWKLHHPVWLPDSPVDLDYHLRQVRVPQPGGRRELDQVIGEVASTPLDRSRPLWELYFADGLADGRIAVIGKVHHVLADGVAAANLLARGMELTNRPTESDLAGAEGHPPTSDPPSSTELLRFAAHDHLQQIARLPALVKDAVGGFHEVRKRSRQRGKVPDMAKPFAAPATFLNHVVSPARTFASAPVLLSEVKETAKKLDSTINDVILATAAGALRTLLLRYDGHADEPVVASVPVSTDRSPDRVSGNMISGLMVSLPVHLDDPLERLRVTAQSAAIAKENNELISPDLYSRFMSYLPTALAPSAFRWQAAHADTNRMMNVPVSNVPGPREAGRLGGAVVTEIYSTGVLSPGVGLNITVWSYVDQVNIAVLSDDRTFGDVHEATDAMLAAFAELRSAAGFSGVLTEPEAALPRATAAR
ncbi:MAG: wax ester/triacylglycerol synthase family O-acyltransferase [Mycobacterium sp.]